MSLIKKINDPNGKKYDDFSIGSLVLDTEPIPGSFNTITSDAVAKIAGDVADLDAIVPEGASGENKLATAADVAGVQEDVDTIEGKIPSDTSTTNKLVNESGLQGAIDNASESWSTGFTPKGESSVSDLNGLSTQSNGDSYIVTDSGTLTDGSLAVVAGDQVAWDATNSVWYKLPQYALKQYGTDEIHNLSQEATSFASSDYFAVSNTTIGARKMSKDTLLELTAQNALGSIKSLATTKYKGFMALDDADGTGKFDIAKIFENFAPEYNGTTGAVAGRLYMNNGTEYLCIKDTSGTFDASCFVNKIMLDGTTFANGQLIADKSKDYGWTDGCCESTDGSITTSTKFQYNSILIPVLPGGTYSLGHRESAERIYFYDSEQNFISASSRQPAAVDSITFTVPDNCYFVRYSFRNQEGYTSGSVLMWSGPFSSESIQKIEVSLKNFGKQIDGLSRYFVKISTTFTDGKYIAYNTGNLGNLSDCSASDYIDIADASLVNINKAITSAADSRGAAFYDSAKNYISGYQYAVNTPDIYINVPTNAKYIRFTAQTSQLTSTEIRKVDVFGAIDKVYTRIDDSVDSIINVAIGAYTDGKYVNYANGVVSDIIGASVTDYIPIGAVSKLRLIAASISTADARGVAFYSSSKVYISGYQYTGADVDVELSVPSNAMYIRFTTKTSEKSNTHLYLDDIYGSLERMDGRLYELELEPDGNVLAAFNNIVCIGDSLTWSQVYTAANSQRRAYRTYPQVLGKLCGADSVESFAIPGDTVIVNWERYKNDVESKINALAIIYLGTNDGLTDTLSEDAPENTDPSTWADTNTGDYAKWVSKLQGLGYKVLLIKPWAGGGGTPELLATTKAVISQIGTRFGCAVLDSFVNTDYKYHYYPDLSGSNSVHYNDLGYAWFASMLIKKASQLGTDQMKYIIPE